MEKEIIETNSKNFWTFIILFSVGLIFTFSFIVISEILSAKTECEEIGGVHKIKSFEHFCNNKSFIKYTDGSWEIEQEQINLSNFLD